MSAATSVPRSSSSRAEATPEPASAAETVRQTGCDPLSHLPAASGPDSSAVGASSSRSVSDSESMATEFCHLSP